MVSKSPPNIEEQIEKGISVLRNGGLVAYPTDTVYGLGAGTAFPEAIERIYQVKERPRNMPLPLLLADVSQIGEVVAHVSPVTRLLIDLASLVWQVDFMETGRNLHRFGVADLDPTALVAAFAGKNSRSTD